MARDAMTDSSSVFDLKNLLELGASGGGPAPAHKAPWPTTRSLHLLLTLTSVATLVFFLAIEAGLAQFHYAMKTVGHDSAPSIVLAEQIKTYLADMDAEVANELIARPGQNQQAQDAYESDRKQVTDGLVGAAANVTYGDAERIPIRTIEEGLGVYEADVAQSRVFHKRGGDPQVLPAYHQGTVEMHSVLLPAADALDRANNDVLTKVYVEQKADFAGMTALLWITGLLLLAALIVLQVFLLRRTHRIINPLLALATVLAAGFLIVMANAYGRQEHLLKVAKQDCFDSVYALWHARAVAYDANASESRWLLDPAYSKESAAEFSTGIARLASFGPGDSFDRVADIAEQATGDAVNWSNVTPSDFKGYMADEMRNITFVGEREAVVATLRALGAYVAVDGRIRRLQNSGRHADAIDLCVGQNPGQSDWAFSQFDNALGLTIDINQKQFDLAVKRGDSELLPFVWLTPAVSMVVAALSLLGILPRLREYR